MDIQREPESAVEAALAPGNRRKSLLIAVWFFFLLALANLMWAGQGIAVKKLEHNLGPIALTFLPFYIATILLIPLLFWERRGNPQAVWPTRGDWKAFAAAGIFGQIAAQYGATKGVLLSTASNYSILNLLVPVITAVMATYMLREKMTPLRILCLFIGLVGVFFLSVDDLKQASFINMKYLIGNLLVIVSCLGSAYYNVYCKGLLARFRQTEILIYSYIVASVVTIPLLIWSEPFHLSSLASITLSGWIAFVFLAVFMYGVSMILFFYVLRHLTVTVASFSIYLVPVFGVALAYWLLHERLTWIQLVGTGIVLLATLLIMKYDTLEA